MHSQIHTHTHTHTLTHTRTCTHTKMLEVDEDLAAALFTVHITVKVDGGLDVVCVGVCVAVGMR